MLPGDVLEVQEVVEGAQLRRDGFMATGFAARGVWAPGVVGTSHEAVVRAFTFGMSDRMDRRHVQNVEAHRGDRRYACLSFAKSRTARGIGALGTWEDLVPGGKSRFQAIHD